MKYEPRSLEKTGDISKGEQTHLDRLKFLATVVLVLGGGWFALGLIADVVAENLPDEMESKYLRLRPAGAIQEDDRLERPQTLFDQLRQDPAVRGLRYELFMLEMGVPNAVAVPGGGVGVTPELLDRIGSDIGLAMVLGHELGHHSHRHVLRLAGRALLRAIAGGILFGGTGAETIAGRAQQLAQQSYARDAEREADDFGLRLVYRTFGTTEGALEFFEWAKTQDGHVSKVGAWMQTHPLSAERLKTLTKLSKELEETNARHR